MLILILVGPLPETLPTSLSDQLLRKCFQICNLGCPPVSRFINDVKAPARKREEKQFPTNARMRSAFQVQVVQT